MELTKREQEVLELHAHGLSNKLIADMLGITEQTVKNHASNVLTKLGAVNRAHAVLLAKEKSLLPKATGEPTPDGCDFKCGKKGEPMIALVNTDTKHQWTATCPV